MMREFGIDGGFGLFGQGKRFAAPLPPPPGSPWDLSVQWDGGVDWS